MSRYRLILVLFAAIAVQASLGGLRASSIVLCLGHAETTTQAEQPAAHHACAHESGGSIPLPTDPHKGECECLDIDLALTDLTHVPRDRDDAANNLGLDAQLPILAHTSAPPACGLSRPPDPDPGAEWARLILRSTILLI